MKEKNCRSKQAARRVIGKLTGLYREPEHVPRASDVNGLNGSNDLISQTKKRKWEGVVRGVSRMPLGGGTVGNDWYGTSWFFLGWEIETHIPTMNLSGGRALIGDSACMDGGSFFY